jgi:hypothetical protein
MKPLEVATHTVPHLLLALLALLLLLLLLLLL